MNDAQLENFFTREMTRSDSMLLMSYLRSRPNMWTYSHVPLISNVLCALWETKGAANADEALGRSENGLYTKMSHYMWKRYSEQQTFPQGNNVIEQLSKTV